MQDETFVPVEYVLEVYYPGSYDTLANRFQTKTSLMVPRVGEIIRTVSWAPAVAAPNLRLEVVAVEHVIEPRSPGAVRNIAMIFTKVHTNWRRQNATRAGHYGFRRRLSARRQLPQNRVKTPLRRYHASQFVGLVNVPRASVRVAGN
jgi:hypothetical protein